MRKILSLAAGIIIGLLIVYLMRVFFLGYYPFPSDLVWKDPGDMEKYFKGLPDKAFVWFSLSHTCATFTAGLISSLVSKKARFTMGVIAATVIFVIVLTINFAFDYPKFYVMADTFFTALGGFLGAMIGYKRQTR